MDWTREIPTWPGYYWVLWNRDPQESMEVVYVSPSTGGPEVWYWSDTEGNEGDAALQPQAQWCGPLIPPAPPTEQQQPTTEAEGQGTEEG